MASNGAQAQALVLALALALALALELPLSMLQSDDCLIFGRLSAHLTGPRTGVSAREREREKRLNLADTTNYCEKNQLYGSFWLCQRICWPRPRRAGGGGGGLIDGPASAPLATCHLLLTKLGQSR